MYIASIAIETLHYKYWNETQELQMQTLICKAVENRESVELCSIATLLAFTLYTSSTLLLSVAI